MYLFLATHFLSSNNLQLFVLSHYFENLVATGSEITDWVCMHFPVVKFDHVFICMVSSAFRSVTDHFPSLFNPAKSFFLFVFPKVSVIPTLI